MNPTGLNSSHRYPGMNNNNFFNPNGPHPANGNAFNASMIEQEMRITNFVFPAIGVKTFYESTHKKLDQDKRLSKKANLYAMIKLESFVMPQHMVSRDIFMNSRDMCISPGLLDFLEQTLEPFDMIKAAFDSSSSNGNSGLHSGVSNPQQQAKHREPADPRSTVPTRKRTPAQFATSNTAASSVDVDSPSTTESRAQQGALMPVGSSTTTTATAAYFPIDVVVFISMLPSSIRFTCLPQSTMECLLKLPSVEMVFSTNRIDEHTQSRLATLLNSEKFNEELR
jgi:hypothetical protein